MRSLFDDWQKVFERGRYDYEFWDQISEIELIEIQKEWIREGAPDSEATLRFHPFELTVIVEALHALLLRRLHP